MSEVSTGNTTLAARAWFHLDPSAADRFVYPCSRAQQLILASEQLQPDTGLNVAGCWLLDGELANATIEQAWRHLIARHECLRTYFDTADGEEVQIVEPSTSFALSYYDLRGSSESEGQLAAEQIVVAEIRRRFDRGVAPLFRLSRIALSDTRSTLVIAAHRAICDGESLEILIREMCDVCSTIEHDSEIAFADVPVSFGRLAETERERLREVSSQQEIDSSWEALQEFVPFELLPDRPRPAAGTFNSRIATRNIEQSIAAAFSDMARRAESSEFEASLAALAVVLHRYSGETDISIGTQFTGRDSDEPRGMVGCFSKMRLIRADLSNDPTYTELLDRIRGSVINGFDLERLSFGRLGNSASSVRDLSRNALFSVNFWFERLPVRTIVSDRFTLSRQPSCATGALYDLNFIVSERPDGWALSCEYSADLFDDDTANGLLDRLEFVVGSVVLDVHQHVSHLPLMNAAERRRLVIEANQTQVEYPRDQTVIDLFDSQVATRPAATAVLCGDVALTYAELDTASNRLAAELIRRGLGGGKRVGVLLERSTDLVVALLGVLKSASAYVPLDPHYPLDRLSFIVSNSRVSAVISRSTLNELISVVNTPFVNIDTDATAIDCNSAEPIVPRALPSDLAYIIFTSGSTGQPKGVSVAHRGLVNVLCAVSREDAFCITASDVNVAVATISFDIATLELFLPLINGARLVVANELEAADGHALHGLLARTGATFMQGTPITWELLMEAGWIGDPPLKILTGGEAISRRLAEQLLERGNELWNGYGPTETTILSSIVRVRHGTGPVLMGPPLANTQFYVLDRNGELVPPGVAGELYIGGDGVAAGYFERSDLSSERFLLDAFRDVPGAKLYRTGDVVRRRGPQSFEFLGRSDHQVKIRGFRIELGEIEEALLRQPDVKEAIVVIRGIDAAEKAIWAFVVFRDDVNEEGEAWIASLRYRLSKSLPQYMVPSPIVVLDALPRTPNGKVDRHALPQNVDITANSHADEPAGPIELAVAELISEILRCQSVGRNDDIFLLGLHSLLAVRLVARIERSIGVRLALRDVYDARTVAQLALRIASVGQSASVQAEPKSVVTFNEHGSRPPFFYLHHDLVADGMYCRRLASEVGTAQPIHAIAPHGTLGLPLESTIEKMALDYLPRIRTLQPKGPYRLGGFCAGGMIAYEISRLLTAQGESVERLVMINVWLPPSYFSGIADPIIRAIGLNPRLHRRFRDVFFRNVGRLFEALDKGPRAVLSFVTERMGLIRRAKRHSREGPDNRDTFEQHRDVHAIETYFAHQIAPLTYHPQPYDGEVTLIWSAQQGLTSNEANRGWDLLVKALTTVSIPGSHFSPLQEDVEDLARALRRALS